MTSVAVDETSQNSSFDLKIGRHLHTALETNILFSTHHLTRKDALKNEIQNLYDLGFLKPQVALEYQSPSFIIPMKNGRQRAIIPVAKIQEILTSLIGFTSATSIDLNKSYS